MVAIARRWVAGAIAALVLGGGPALAETAAIAVATNFVKPLEALAADFAAATGHGLAISSGSTGKLYAQIGAGAPFDVFLAADAERPAALEAAGAAVPGSRFTYAVGRLVLLSRSPEATGRDCLEFLRGATGKLAIANPATAPYGAAAVQALDALGLGEAMTARLVLGGDIGQVFAFVDTGNAVAGFVALSQVAAEPAGGEGCRWEVPGDLHQPIEQQAVLLARGAGNPAAVAFLDYLRGPRAAATIAGFGYGAAP